MYLKRKVDKEIEKWANNENKMPLVILGARQVGKTTTVKNITSKLFKHVYYINFNDVKNDPRFLEFKSSPTWKKLIDFVQLMNETIITLEQDSVLIIDEFQEVIEFYSQLKTINENSTFKNIICLGIFLTVKVFANKVSVPVGQIQTITMYTLSFEEFLMNVNPMIYCKLEECYQTKSIDKMQHAFFSEAFKQYLVIGGYPKPIVEYLENDQNFLLATHANETIFDNYESDIAKFVGNENIAKVRDIFLNTFIFMGKESNTFTLSSIKTSARYRDYEFAMLLLIKSHIVHKVDNCKNLIFPICPMDKSNKFKVYPCDVGLISAYYKINMSNIESEGFKNIKGNMIEAYIISECMRNKIQPYYHTFRFKDNTYELDLVYHDENLRVNIVEIKSGKNKKSNSLNKVKDNANSNIMTTSLDNVIDETHIPLYMFGYKLTHK